MNFTEQEAITLLEAEEKRLQEQEDCDHRDLECGHCIECGKDCTEDLFSRAYDRAKAHRHYGDLA